MRPGLPNLLARAIVTAHVYLSDDHAVRLVIDDKRKLAALDFPKDDPEHPGIEPLMMTANAYGWCSSTHGRRSEYYEDGTTLFRRAYLSPIDECPACNVHEVPVELV